MNFIFLCAFSCLHKRIQKMEYGPVMSVRPPVCLLLHSRQLPNRLEPNLDGWFTIGTSPFQIYFKISSFRLFIIAAIFIVLSSWVNSRLHLPIFCVPTYFLKVKMSFKCYFLFLQIKRELFKYLEHIHFLQLLHRFKPNLKDDFWDD